MSNREKEKTQIAKNLLIDIRRNGQHPELKKTVNYVINTISKLNGQVAELILKNAELKKQVKFQKRIIRTITKDQEEN